jgi:hypothetical protein
LRKRAKRSAHGWNNERRWILITKIQMQKYWEFDGDLDEWVRSQKDGLDATLTGTEWELIDKLVQRLRIQKGGNASSDYKDETERVLKKNLENEDVIRMARERVK